VEPGRDASVPEPSDPFLEPGDEPWDPAPRTKSPARRLRIHAERSVSRARSHLELRLDSSYRRLARSYRLPDGSRRVYCYHVRKTAGTSLGFSFLALGDEDPLEVWRRMTTSRLRRTVSGPYAFAAYVPFVLSEGAYFFGRSHRSYDDQPLPEGTFTVTVLRDPLDRVHSYFDYLVAGDWLGRLGGRERRRATGGFDAFLERVPDRNLLNQLATFSKQLDISEAVERIAGCSCVLSTSNFSRGLADLGRRLELPLAEHRVRVTTTRSSLSEEQRDRLLVRLQPEYEFLRRLESEGVIDTAERP
jgi:hypothetical protein